MTPNQACELARALDGVTEKDHFGSDAFIANGRIFMTVWHDKKIANLMLSRALQKPFLAQDGGDAFRTINGAWGDQAFTAVLHEIETKLFKEALKAAWENSANKRTRLKGSGKKPKPARGGTRGKPRR